MIKEHAANDASITSDDTDAADLSCFIAKCDSNSELITNAVLINAIAVSLMAMNLNATTNATDSDLHGLDY